MKNLFRTLSILAVASAVISCSRTSSSSFSEDTQVFGPKNLRLKLESSADSQYQYTYDAQGKLTAVSVKNLLTAATEEYTFVYYNDKLSKALAVRSDNPGLTSEYNAVYAADGQLAKFIFTEHQTVGAETFTVQGTADINYTGTQVKNLQVLRKTSVAGGELKQTENYTLEYAQNMLAKMQYVSEITATGIAMPPVTSSRTAEVLSADDGKNPMRSVPRFWTILSALRNPERILGESQRNIKQIKWIQSGTELLKNWEYTYNEDKYPLTAISGNEVKSYTYIQL